MTVEVLIGISALGLALCEVGRKVGEKRRLREAEYDEDEYEEDEYECDDEEDDDEEEDDDDEEEEEDDEPTTVDNPQPQDQELEEPVEDEGFESDDIEVINETFSERLAKCEPFFSKDQIRMTETVAPKIADMLTEKHLGPQGEFYKGLFYILDKRTLLPSGAESRHSQEYNNSVNMFIASIDENARKVFHGKQRQKLKGLMASLKNSISIIH